MFQHLTGDTPVYLKTSQLSQNNLQQRQTLKVIEMLLMWAYNSHSQLHIAANHPTPPTARNVTLSPANVPGLHHRHTNRQLKGSHNSPMSTAVIQLQRTFPRRGQCKPHTTTRHSATIRPLHTSPNRLSLFNLFLTNWETTPSLHMVKRKLMAQPLIFMLEYSSPNRETS